MNEGPCGATGHAGGLIMEDQKPMQSGLNAENMYFSSYTWARGRAAPGLAPSGAQSIVQDLTPFHQPPPQSGPGWCPLSLPTRPHAHPLQEPPSDLLRVTGAASCLLLSNPFNQATLSLRVRDNTKFRSEFTLPAKHTIFHKLEVGRILGKSVP